MDALIKNLRTKSEEAKKKWVKILALIATALLVAVWLLFRYVLFVPPERIDTDQTPSTLESINTIYEDSVNQFDTLRNNSESNSNFFPDFSVPEDESMTLEEPSLNFETENEIEFDNQPQPQSEPEPEVEPETQPSDFFNT